MVPEPAATRLLLREAVGLEQRAPRAVRKMARGPKTSGCRPLPSTSRVNQESAARGLAQVIES